MMMMVDGPRVKGKNLRAEKTTCFVGLAGGLLMRPKQMRGNERLVDYRKPL